MSFSGGVFTRAGGINRCDVEAATGSGFVLSSPMDAEFNEIAAAFNLCFLRDGSAAATANFDINGFNLLDVGTITGNVLFTGSLNLADGAAMYGSLSVYDDVLIDGDANITGTIQNALMPVENTYSPEVQPTGTGSFTTSVQEGSYLTIGNVVIATIYVEASQNSPTGGLRVTLPVACGTIAGAGVIGDHGGITSASRGLNIEAFPGQSYAIIKQYEDTGFTADIDCANDLLGAVSFSATIIYVKA